MKKNIMIGKTSLVRVGCDLFRVMACGAVALAATFGAQAMEWTPGDLVIPSGEEVTVSEYYKTNTSVTISGTFTTDLKNRSKYYYILAAGDPKTETTNHFAPNPGDNALWNVGGVLVYGYKDSPRANFIIGNNGGGNGLFHIAAIPATNYYTSSVVWIRDVTLSENARTSDDSFKTILVNSRGQLMCRQLVNNNTKPL